MCGLLWDLVGEMCHGGGPGPGGHPAFAKKPVPADDLFKGGIVVSFDPGVVYRKAPLFL